MPFLMRMIGIASWVRFFCYRIQQNLIWFGQHQNLIILSLKAYDGSQNPVLIHSQFEHVFCFEPTLCFSKNCHKGLPQLAAFCANRGKGQRDSPHTPATPARRAQRVRCHPPSSYQVDLPKAGQEEISCWISKSIGGSIISRVLLCFIVDKPETSTFRGVHGWETTQNKCAKGFPLAVWH